MRRDRHGLPRKDVTAIKWKCAICDSVQVSRSDRRHEMDACECKKSALDLEEYYQRNMGAIVILEQVECDYKEMLIPGLEQDISILAAVKVLAVQDMKNHIRYQVVDDAEYVMNVVTYYEEHHELSIKEVDELKYYLRNWLRNYRAKQNKEDETNQDTQKNED